MFDAIEYKLFLISFGTLAGLPKMDVAEMAPVESTFEIASTSEVTVKGQSVVWYSITVVPLPSLCLNMSSQVQNVSCIVSYI